MSAKSTHRKAGRQAQPVGLHPADENLLRAVRFERPDYIPMTYHINAACWHHFPQSALVDLMEEFPELFGHARPPRLPYTPEYLPNAVADRPFTDPWGCVWKTADDGIVGTVVVHPLADYAALETYQPPDPARGDGMGHYLLGPAEQVPAADASPAGESAGKQSAAGQAASEQTAAGPSAANSARLRRLKTASLRHGHTFQQLCDLRGYTNLMLDMADQEPRLWRLIEMVENFNLALVQRDLAAGAEWMGYPEDLGAQRGPLISPAHFRKYIQPVYRRLIAPARQAGAVVHMHSDGHLHALVDDLLACEIDVLNLQDLVNGIEWIAEQVKGRVCIDLDIDRQQITTRGTPEQIDALIRREVEALGSPQGGLTMIYGLYPGTPLENARAVAQAMRRYAGYWS